MVQQVRYWIHAEYALQAGLTVTQLVLLNPQLVNNPTKTCKVSAGQSLCKGGQSESFISDVCVPTVVRQTLLSGLFVHRHRVSGNMFPGFQCRWPSRRLGQMQGQQDHGSASKTQHAVVSAGCVGTVCGLKVSAALSDFLNFPNLNLLMCGLLADCGNPAYIAGGGGQVWFQLLPPRCLRTCRCVHTPLLVRCTL
jgi:hypothetical protein